MSIRPSIVVPLILLFCASATAQTLGKLDPLVQARVGSLLGRSKVIVRAQDASYLGLVAALIQQAGGTPGRQLPLIESIVADLPNAALAALVNSPAVKRIAL